MSTRACPPVPQVMQMESLECGAACLTMILACYGKWIPLEQVRRDCGVSRDGSNARNILRAARSYGLLAQGYRMEMEALGEALLPCIIHWNFNHFVVFRGFKGQEALINDPARGPVSIPREEFSRSFTGIALCFEPGPSFEKGGKPRSILGFVRSRMRRMGIPSAFIFLTGLVLAVLGVLNPVASQVFLDQILSGVHPEWLSPLLGVLLGAGIIEGVVILLQSIYLLNIEGVFGVTANARFFWRILHLPLEFFSHRFAGDIASRQASNEMVASVLLQTLAPQVLNLVLLILYLVFMLRYSVSLTLAGLGALVLNIAAARYISRKRIDITRVQARDEGRLAAITVSGIDMIETLKASGAEGDFFERWAGYQAAVNADQVQFQKKNALFGRIPLLLGDLSNLVVLGLGLFFILQGTFTLGMLLAFQGFLSSFLRPTTALIEAGQGIQEMRTSMERIEDVMNYPADPPGRKEGQGEEYHKLKGAISIRNLSFGYSKLAKPLIEDFSLEVKAGSSVALVGPSGCGKSTLAKLIAGLYEPWSGEILFDGIPRGEIPREILTGSLAVVDQDISIFEDTVARNIKMWDSSIEDFEMILAAKDAGIHQDILLRENGYYHRLLEGGRDFSGGQRQRLEIARLLAQDPTIAVLDEATSALDTKTEEEVLLAIEKRDITRIIVAHRLSTIRDCDEIVVLDQGRMKERGTHRDLLALGGMYAALVNSTS